MEWFHALDARAQRKQVNRWRYYRQFYRRKFGDRWALYIS